MKKFSETLPKDRDFEFLGELFKYKLVHWSVITQIVDGSPNGKEPTATQSIQEIIDLIPQFIDDENQGPSRMKSLLEGTDKAVPIGQVNALYEWLLEVSSGRPTEAPSPSPGGRQRTGAT